MPQKNPITVCCYRILNGSNYRLTDCLNISQLIGIYLMPASNMIFSKTHMRYLPQMYEVDSDRLEYCLPESDVGKLKGNIHHYSDF